MTEQDGHVFTPLRRPDGGYSRRCQLCSGLESEHAEAQALAAAEARADWESDEMTRETAPCPQGWSEIEGGQEEQ